MNILTAIFGAATQGLTWGIMGLGVYITFKILDIPDMTCDGSFALGGCFCATLIAKGGMNPYLALLLATIAGGVAGLVTGVLHTKLKIPAILSGILTMLGLYSINMRIMGQSNTPIITRNGDHSTLFTDLTSIFPKSFQELSSHKDIVTGIYGILFVVLFIFLLYWFFGTEIGSALRATGNNESMVRALGVSTDGMKILGLVLGNCLVAFSGALVAQSNEVADVGMGTGTIVIGLASIVIGEVTFGQKLSFYMKLFSVIVGSIVYRIIIAVVLQVGMNPNDLKLLSAGIVVVALVISNSIRRTTQKSS